MCSFLIAVLRKTVDSLLVKFAFKSILPLNIIALSNKEQVSTEFGKCKYEYFQCSTSSHQRCSMNNGVLNNFANFTGKCLCHSVFFKIKLQASGQVLRTPFYRTPLDDCLWYSKSVFSFPRFQITINLLCNTYFVMRDHRNIYLR